VTVRLTLSFLVSFVAGLSLVSLTWPDPRPSRRDAFLRLSLAGGLGFGLSSEVYVLWLEWSTGSARDLWLSDWLLLGALGGTLLIRLLRYSRPSRREEVRPTPYAPGASRRTAVKLLTVSASAALLLALYVFVSASWNHPHGGWDAWMSWNLRARFFFRGGEHWRDAFSSLFWGANPEYPVFLPATVARLWQQTGRETPLAPALVAFVFTFSTVALTSAALSLLRSRGQGRLGGLLLLGTPFFLQHGAYQMADVPLGFFFLASLVTLCVGDRFFPGSPGPPFLCGLSAGLAAWTKNEGALFLLALAIAAVVVLARRGELRSHLRQALAFGAGLLVVLPLAVHVKVDLAPPDIMLAWNGERLHALVEWRRYAKVLWSLGVSSLHFGSAPVQLLPVLVFYGLLLGADTCPARSSSTAIASGALALTLAGYGLAYVTTPQDLAWHLRTSVDRLLLQLWPSAVFLFFLLLRTPEQALAEDARIGLSREGSG
jgi:hypothetical protein